MLNAKQRPIRFIILFYLVCCIPRIFEYFVLRTDQGIFGEAFIHKLIGILLLALVVWQLKYKWSDIGFRADKAVKGLLLGLLFGIVMFAASYGTELLMQISASNAPSLEFFVTSYTVQGNRAMQSGFVFVLICIVGNIINVIMEEGIFRGLFMRLAEGKYSFWKACMVSSLLFGIWHIASPIRNVVDGVQSPMGAAMMGLMLVVTSALAGIQYVMLYKMTGSIWISTAFHFVNNASVNLLHVVTGSGIDELQTVRLTVSGTLSFVIVLAFFISHQRKEKQRRQQAQSTIE